MPISSLGSDAHVHVRVVRVPLPKLRDCTHRNHGDRCVCSVPIVVAITTALGYRRLLTTDERLSFQRTALMDQCHP
jgi:hypothetical protein